MPPLQRTVGDLDLVVDPDGFRGSLGTWQNASLTGVLGHVVSPEAPSGLVHGVAEPSRDPEPVPHEGPPATRHFPAPGRGGVPEPPAAVPVQRVAAAEPLTRVRPLTSASPPQTRLQRQLTPVGTDDVVSPESPPRAPVVPGADDRSEGRGPVQRAAAAEGGEPARPPRVFGLGRPLSELPPTAQREPAARADVPSPFPPGPAPEPEAEPAQESGPGEEAPSRPLLGEDPLTVPEAPTPPEPAVRHAPVPLQRLPAATDERTGPVPAPTGPVVPLVAQRSVPLFSSPEQPSSSPPEPEAGPRVVPVRWEAPAAPPAPGPGPGAGPTAATPVQRAAVQAVPEDATVLDSRPPSGPRRLASPPAPPPAPVQRATPGPAYARPAPSGGLVDAGAVAVAAGVAQRMPDGSVVFHTPAAMPAPAPTLQRQDETDAAPEPMPEPPGAESTAGMGDPAEAAASTAPAPEQAGGGADGAGGQSGTPAVSDEMVRALYAPLSRMLRAELRLERERAGFLINTRH
ncbi:hypothetical protein [Streptomyces sp. 6N223]|uniref:hypothetical protein n=1 Tax=Streptomyces sp. 6N223 TaxID=3457412 RepID=UPI003FD27EA5